VLGDAMSLLENTGKTPKIRNRTEDGKVETEMKGTI
jgi:hypothetical protein